jgi:hypothetical protein
MPALWRSGENAVVSKVIGIDGTIPKDREAHYLLIFQPLEGRKNSE